MYSSRCGPLRGERVLAALGAPGKEAAEIGFGVLAGGALETGQVSRHCQPQLVVNGAGGSEAMEASSAKSIMLGQCGCSRFARTAASPHLAQQERRSVPGSDAVADAS
jgi:hypothetical protein